MVNNHGLVEKNFVLGNHDWLFVLKPWNEAFI
jgi:hypothetical protein